MTGVTASAEPDRAAVRQVLTEDQDALRKILRTLLSRRSTDFGVGQDPALWAQLCEMGVPGIAVPSRFGGGDGGSVEVTIVAEELGASLAPVPFLSTLLAVETLLALGDEAACADVLPRVCGGELSATVALDLGLRPVATVRAEQRGTAYALTGTVEAVLDLSAAGLVLCVADLGGVLTMFAVEPTADGVTVDDLETLDLSRNFGRLTLRASPATRIAGDAAAAVHQAGTRMAIAVAAEQFGVMRRSLEITNDYAKLREQFGRTIGSFQAVKHGLADMLIACDLAESAVRYAAAVADTDESQLEFAASMAKAHCNDVCVEVATAMIRYHGGIGFTWEHVAHRYYRRAYSDAVLLGSSAHHRGVLAELLHLLPNAGSPRREGIVRA